MKLPILIINMICVLIQLIVAFWAGYTVWNMDRECNSDKAMKKWEKKYNKRFYKKPCADCYCKDCKYFWNGEGVIEAGACEFYGKDTPDDGFCWRAVRKE